MIPKEQDARYVQVNGHYYSRKKIEIYEAHPLTEEQREILKEEEANMRKVLRTGSCSRPSLRAMTLMGELTHNAVNGGCQRCINRLVTDAAEYYFYAHDKAIEEQNAKAFIEKTLKAEAPAPAKKRAAPKEKAAPKKK